MSEFKCKVCDRLVMTNNPKPIGWTAISYDNCKLFSRKWPKFICSQCSKQVIDQAESEG